MTKVAQINSSCPGFPESEHVLDLYCRYIIGLLCIMVPANRTGISKKARYREIVVGKPSDPLTLEKLVKPLARRCTNTHAGTIGEFSFGARASTLCICTRCSRNVAQHFRSVFRSLINVTNACIKILRQRVLRV